MSGTGSTPLWNILECPRFSKEGSMGSARTVQLNDPDKILETVRVLLEFGADPDLELLITTELTRKSMARARQRSMKMSV